MMDLNMEIILPILIQYLSDHDKLIIKCISKKIYNQNIFFVLDTMKINIPIIIWYYNNITSLEVSDVIDFYPKLLKSLKFDDHFNKPWKTPLLASLTSLHFGYRFNQPWTCGLVSTNITIMVSFKYVSQSDTYLNRNIIATFARKSSIYCTTCNKWKLYDITDLINKLHFGYRL